MIGLKYVGAHEEGIRVMLYKSYKTVPLRKDLPYTFTPVDDTSKEAENYYKQLKGQGVETTDNPEDLVVKGSRQNPVKRVQIPEALMDIPKDEPEVTAPESEDIQLDEVKVDGTVTSDEVGATEETKQQVINLEVNPDELEGMTDAELAEYLDMSLDRDQIKDIIEKCEMDISVGRRGKSSLISDILENYKDKLVEYLTNK